MTRFKVDCREKIAGISLHLGDFARLIMKNSNYNKTFSKSEKEWQLERFPRLDYPGQLYNSASKSSKNINYTVTVILRVGAHLRGRSLGLYTRGKVTLTICNSASSDHSIFLSFGPPKNCRQLNHLFRDDETRSKQGRRRSAYRSENQLWRHQAQASFLMGPSIRSWNSLESL